MPAFHELATIDRLALCGSFVMSTTVKMSKHEAAWVHDPSSWTALLPVLEAKSPYEALMKMSFSPASDTFTSMMFLAGSVSMFQPGESEMPAHMKNVLFIIDNCTELDDMFKNTRVMKMLLAVSASSRTPGVYVQPRAKCILAHVFKKFPDFFKLSVLKTKSGRMKFKPEDVEKWI